MQHDSRKILGGLIATVLALNLGSSQKTEKIVR